MHALRTAERQRSFNVDFLSGLLSASEAAVVVIVAVPRLDIHAVVMHASNTSNSRRLAEGVGTGCRVDKTVRAACHEKVPPFRVTSNIHCMMTLAVHRTSA